MKKFLLLLILPFSSFGQTPCLDAVASATGAIGEYIPQCPEQLEFYNDNFLMDYNLDLIYPNPFNSTVTIKYSINKAENIILSLYDLNGRLLETLESNYKLPGNYQVLWHATQYPSGLYFIRLHSSSFSETQKLLHIK